MEQAFVNWRIMWGKRDRAWTGQQNLGPQKKLFLQFVSPYA
jgi:hypothetical protein